MPASTVVRTKRDGLITHTDGTSDLARYWTAQINRPLAN